MCHWHHLNSRSGKGIRSDFNHFRWLRFICSKWIRTIYDNWIRKRHKIASNRNVQNCLETDLGDLQKPNRRYFLYFVRLWIFNRVALVDKVIEIGFICESVYHFPFLRSFFFFFLGELVGPWNVLIAIHFRLAWQGIGKGL